MNALTLRSAPAPGDASAGRAGPRHFLELDAVPAADLRRIVDEGLRRKAARAGVGKGAADSVVPGLDAPLAGRVLAMVFEKPSTRTRVSFEMAIRQLGGDATVLNAGDLQLGRGETVADTARVLSGYVDAVMLRTFSPATLDEMAAHADVPVINGLTDRSHPCQIIADILTFEEVKGPIAGAKLAWLGDGNNVAATFIQAAPAFGFEIHIACPDTRRPDADIVAAATAAGAKVVIGDDPLAAVDGADCVVTDTWLSMTTTTPPARRATRCCGPSRSTPPRWRGPSRTRSSCIACPPIAGKRRRRRSWTGPARSSSARPRTGSMRRRACCSGASDCSERAARSRGPHGRPR